ncbi:MAG: hypothetical protein ACE5G8_06660 [Anaerolineae bacterium]
MAHRIRTRQLQKVAQVTVQRALPFPGEIRVQRGQTVTPTEIIGQCRLPGRIVVVNIAAALGLPTPDMAEVMLKGEQQPVEEGEPIARLQSRRPFGKRVCKSPVTGVIAGLVGNRALIETGARLKKVPALVGGQVIRVNHARSVAIQTTATVIQAACGLGKESSGILKAASTNPADDLDGEAFDVLDRQSVFVAGGTVNKAAIRRAEAIGVVGLIVGSIDAALLDMDPPPQIPVVATEGFGRRPMAPQTFELLQTRLNEEASIQMLKPPPAQWGICRPTIFISGPPPGESLPGPEAGVAPAGGVTRRSPVRALREPSAWGRGRVAGIPDAPCVTEAGIAYHGANVTINGETRFIPWFNLEHLL